MQEELLQKGNALLVCPHCKKNQEDPVDFHIVTGRPDLSQSQCIHCYRWFTVIGYDDNQNLFQVIKGKLL